MLQSIPILAFQFLHGLGYRNYTNKAEQNHGNFSNLQIYLIVCRIVLCHGLAERKILAHGMEKSKLIGYITCNEVFNTSRTEYQPCFFNFQAFLCKLTCFSPTCAIATFLPTLDAFEVNSFFCLMSSLYSLSVVFRCIWDNVWLWYNLIALWVIQNVFTFLYRSD